MDFVAVTLKLPVQLVEAYRSDALRRSISMAERNAFLEPSSFRRQTPPDDPAFVEGLVNLRMMSAIREYAVTWGMIDGDAIFPEEAHAKTEESHRAARELVERKRTLRARKALAPKKPGEVD